MVKGVWNDLLTNVLSEHFTRNTHIKGTALNEDTTDL